jgi:hypothetical protein
VAISTKDVYKTAEQIRAAGGKITREPGVSELVIWEAGISNLGAGISNLGVAVGLGGIAWAMCLMGGRGRGRLAPGCAPHNLTRLCVSHLTGPVPGINTKILATTDPDGWKYVLVDEEDFAKELA